MTTLICTLALMASFGQVSGTYAVAASGSAYEESLKTQYGTVYPTVADAILYATDTDGLDTYTLIVGAGTYPVAVEIKGDTVTISGFPATTPYEIIFTGGITISGNAAVTLEGISVQGAPAEGINVKSLGATAISRCYIVGNGRNGDAGIAVSNGTVDITNCPIAKNGGDGITVSNGTVTVTHCSIIGNGKNGILRSAGTVEVANSFIYDNGAGEPIPGPTTALDVPNYGAWPPADTGSEWQFGPPQGLGTDDDIVNPDPVVDADHPVIWGTDLRIDGNYVRATPISAPSPATNEIIAGLNSYELVFTENRTVYLVDISVTVNPVPPDAVKVRLKSPGTPPISADLDRSGTTPGKFSGTFNSFDGTILSGTWILEIEDTATTPTYTGAITAFTGKFTPYLYLTTPTLDVTGYSNIHLHYERYLNQRESVSSVIECSSDDGATWKRVWAYQDLYRDNAWVPEVVPLPDAAGGQVRLRFGYSVPQVAPTLASGWNLANIRLYGVSGAASYYGLNGSITSTDNFVYANQTDNYGNGASIDEDRHPGTDLTADPPEVNPGLLGILNRDFIGQLAFPSSLDCLSGTDTVFSFTRVYRDDPATIGADEVGASLSLASWIDCIVVPHSYGPMFGPLTVDVWFQGGEPEACIVPEGGDRDVPADRIPLTRTDTAGEWYRFTAAPGLFPTLLRDKTGDGPSPDDTFADGHAVVHLWIGDTVVSDDFIETAARNGRNFLIDTIPPYITAKSDGTPDVAVVLHNDPPYTVSAVVWGSDSPGPLGGGIAVPYLRPAAIVPQVDVNEHAPFLYMIDGPTYFFNVGSFSNNYYNYAIGAPYPQFATHAALDIEVQAVLFDPDVVTFYKFTTGASRQVAGFPVIAGETGLPQNIVAAGRLDDGTLLPAQWRIANAVQIPAAAAVTATSQLANPGFFDLGTAKQVAVAWSFSPAGIPLAFLGPPPAYKEIAGKIVPRDAAGNAPYEQTLPPPLRIWWDNAVQTKVTVQFPAGVPYPDISWSRPAPEKNVPPGVGGPEPIATWKLWASSVPGKTGAGGPYIEIPDVDWASWTRNLWQVPYSAIGNLAADPDIGPYVADHHLLVLVALVDECGNVTPWPSELVMNGDGSISAPATTGSAGNWATFYVGGRESAIDTALSVMIRYTEPIKNLGSTPIVPYPTTAGSYVEAQFTVSPVAPDPALFQNVAIEKYVALELEANGQVVWRGVKRISTALPFTLTLPNPYPAESEYLDVDVNTLARDVRTDPVLNLRVLGDPAMKVLVNYVFRAAFYYEDLDNVIIRDPTPASFSFKLIPGTMEDYLKSTRGEQPVKSFENQ